MKSLTSRHIGKCHSQPFPGGRRLAEAMGLSRRHKRCVGLSRATWSLCVPAQAEAGGSLPPDVGEALGALRREQQGLEQELAQR